MYPSIVVQQVEQRICNFLRTTFSISTPILHHSWLHRHEPGIKAILIYPMNALATDQAERIAKEIAKDL